MTHHHHAQNTQSELSFDEKMTKLLEHWIKHNEDHAKTYKDWAEQAKNNDIVSGTQVSFLLTEAAEMNFLMNEKFQNALNIIKSHD